MFRLFLARFMSHFGTRRTGTNLDLTRCSHVSITYWIVPFLFYLVLPGFRSRDSILHVRCLRPKNFFSFRGNLQNLRQALVFFSSSFLCVCVCVCVCVDYLSVDDDWRRSAARAEKKTDNTMENRVRGATSNDCHQTRPPF